ncbi:MAG: M48 family metallopeptidase [Candidatus Thermoplasmatota archaeon]|nr:M48 family metallopeptidase [Candidatus Thermoplasmatota archaeon]
MTEEGSSEEGSSEVDYPYEFDEETRKKAEVYSKQKFYTGIFQSVVLYLSFLFISYLSGFSHFLVEWIRTVVEGTFLYNYWIVAAIFVMIYSALLYLISLPVSYYSGFILEHRYDLSNQTLGDWSKDQVKSFFISLIFLTPLILGVFFLGNTFSSLWWLYAGILLFVISGILSNISHLILLPLFYDLEELKDESLKERLIDMAERHGVKKVEKVVVVKAGEKTEKANAAFAGMGKTKRLLLFDTLLEKFHPKEIESVVAHEMGHYVHKDILRFMMISGLLIFPMFYISGEIFTIWGSFEQIYHLPLFLLIIYGLYSLIDPATKTYSRYRERKADRFALETVNDSNAMVSAFKRLADIDLAELDPSKYIEILFYDHPAPIKRIKMAEEEDQKDTEEDQLENKKDK